MPRKKTTPAPVEETTPEPVETPEVGAEPATVTEPETFPTGEAETFPEQTTPDTDEEPEGEPEVHYPEPIDAETTDPDFEIVDSDEVQEREPTAEELLATARSNTNWYALQKLVADQIYAATKEDKKDVLEAMLKVHALTRAKTFEVVIPTIHGTEEKVAQATLTGGKDGGVEVEDEEDFKTWLEDNRPELVDVIEHPAEPPRPARPAWKETVMQKNALKQVSKILKVVDGKVMDTSTGEFVPGLRYAKPKAPDDFRLSWGGANTPGKHRAMDLLLNKEVAGVTVESLVPMPELEQ